MILYQNGLSFEINENDSTAKVIRPRIVNQSIGDIFIPRFIQYNSKNYSVISICEKAFKDNERISVISFPLDSEIRTIEKKAFLNSSITSINIPKHVTTIEEETFSGCYNLTTVHFPEDSELRSIRTKAFYRTSIKKFYITSKVENFEDDFLRDDWHLINILVSPNNKHFTLYENKFLLFRSNLSQENFDVLFFSPRLIRKALIPSFIKHINSCAFNNCHQLHEIEFTDDSQLQSIGSSAFEDSDLKSIKIPCHVTKIDSKAFCDCEHFSKIEFSENSELRLIGKKAFSRTLIKNFHITSKIEELEEGWCNELNQLNEISISPENKHFKLINDNKLLIYRSDLSQDKYDNLIYASREIESVFVPSFIKHICSSTFCNCAKIKTIEFEENSELETINDNSFMSSSIEKIKIPRHVKTIGKRCFMFCDQLTSIEIPIDSELISIGKYALDNDLMIQSLYIPSNLKEIGKYCFFKVMKLSDISASPNNKNFTFYNNQFLLYKSDPLNENYDQLIIASRNINGNIIIPSFIKKICPYAFSDCKNITSIEFEENSELQIIDKYAFTNSSIQKISLPRSLKKIRNRALGWCINLKTIEIPEDSELISIEQKAFCFSFIEKIFIPPKLEEFDEPFLNNVNQLIDISVSPKNKYFCVHNGQLLLFKSDSLQKNFDKVIIASNTVENVIIPSFIKYLYPFSFYGCNNLKAIEFSEDSELLSIGHSTFQLSSIEKIKIPKHVKKIERYTFYECKKLKCLEFSEDSELISIEYSPFNGSAIEKLFIPSKVENLNKNWCVSTNYLTDISVSPNNKHFIFYNNQMLLYRKDESQNNYDHLIFISHNSKDIVIPSFIKKICSNAAYNCEQLKIEFQKNSQLVSIQNDSFNDSQIKSFCIPRSTKKIGSRAFDFCLELDSIEFLCDEFNEDLMFMCCNNLNVASFPNAHQVYINLRFVSPKFVLFIHVNGKVFF